MTPFRSDFIDYVEADTPVKDVTNVNRVIGIRIEIQNMINLNGQVCYIPFVSCHFLTADVQLFSPYIYHQIHVGSYEVSGD